METLAGQGIHLQQICTACSDLVPQSSAVHLQGLETIVADTWLILLRHSLHHRTPLSELWCWIPLRALSREFCGLTTTLMQDAAVKLRQTFPVAPSNAETKQRLAVLLTTSSPTELAGKQTRAEACDFASPLGCGGRQQLAVASLVLHAQEVVVDHHCMSCFGGQQILCLAWFSYFDGTFWRQCKVYEHWSDDIAGAGEKESLIVAVGIVGLEDTIRFRFNWNWDGDRAHTNRAAAVLRKDPGPEKPRMELTSQELLRVERKQLQHLKACLGIRNSWDDEKFWGLFTSCWASLPLTERCHEFGLKHNCYQALDVAHHLHCSAAGHYHSPGGECPHSNIIQHIDEFHHKCSSWVMDRFLMTSPPHWQSEDDQDLDSI